MDPRIRLIDNEENIGLTRSLNKGIELAKGKYIARMDADDISLPERLEKQVQFLEENNHIVVLGSWFYGIDENGLINSEFKTHDNEENIIKDLFFLNPLGHGSVMFVKEFITSIGGYNPSFIRTQDYDLWIRVVANHGRIINIPLFLLKYRNHPENASNMQSDKQEALAQKAIQNAYKLLLNKKVSLKTIQLVRQLILQGRTKFNFCEKIEVLMLLRKFNKGIRQNYHNNSGVLNSVDEQIGYIYRTVFKNRWLRLLRWFIE